MRTTASSSRWRAETVTAFVERGLAAFAEHGVVARRLMSDNAFAYRHNRSLREPLVQPGIRHLLIPPRRPQPNGKVERYQQTLKREWALGHIYRSSEHRALALAEWLRYYNERRPHNPLDGRPPISRVHNVPRQDTERPAVSRWSRGEVVSAAGWAGVHAADAHAPVGLIASRRSSAP